MGNGGGLVRICTKEPLASGANIVCRSRIEKGVSAAERRKNRIRCRAKSIRSKRGRLRRRQQVRIREKF